MTELQITIRDGKKKPAALRREGFIPAVYYGRTEPSTSVAVSLTDFQKVWQEAGESSVVTLQGPKNKLDALITDVDLDPLTYLPRHADFYVFEEDSKVEVEVPLEFVEIAPAVKEKGAVLVKVMHELKVEASPRNLPGAIEVDVSSLKELDDQILAGDLKLPSGVELVEDPEEVVASVDMPEEESEEEIQEVDFSNIAVEKKGKEEETSAEADS